MILAVAATVHCSDATSPDRRRADDAGVEDELRLDYGPVLRSVDARSARFLFHASRPSGTVTPWTAGIDIGPSPTLDAETLLPTAAVEVGESTGLVAHLTVEGLAPQTRYWYVPLVNGRRALAWATHELPSFLTPPELGGRNADFTAVFLADQHVADGPDTVSLDAYAAAAEHHPLFWAQLGDAATGSLTVGAAEENRPLEELGAIWRRNYGEPASPQVRFAGSHSLSLATISDHELMDNFSMNWHASLAGSVEDATLHDRVERYDRSIGTWWNYFGWGGDRADRLGLAAREDHGESVMAEAPVDVIEDVTTREVCIEDAAARGFGDGDFVFLADDGNPAFHSRVESVGPARGCGSGRGRVVTLRDAPPGEYRVDRTAQLAVGARYARHGHYHAYSPYPFVEFFLLDTTSYRGDPYQQRERYEREANRDTDHSRYPWDAGDGATYIFGDREHGANRTTDGVRSWLGPTQRDAFLEAIAASRAGVLVVAAGYPLHSAKFEWSDRYWEGRESGFDFASELDTILSALDRLDRLVLWVHGDGHTPMLVRLRPDVYQLQIGPTLMGHTENPGHRSRTLASGDRSDRDSIGGGELIAGHQPDLLFGDANEDFFAGHLEQFEGFLRLYFHPGREALRSSERSGLRRGSSDRVLEIPSETDPARGAAGSRIVGKVARLHFGERHAHSVVASYRHEGNRVLLELEDPIVTEEPDLLRVILDATPWVEARWFDSRGREWREFAAILREAPGDR